LGKKEYHSKDYPGKVTKEGSLLEKHLMKDSDVYKFIFERKEDPNTIGIKGRRFLERYFS
jgi:hypothetical protein